MLAVKADVNAGSTPAIAPRQHASFFRQSGWLMIATVAGGVMTGGVISWRRAQTSGERNMAVCRHSALGAMVIPAMPLQMVLAQQTAAGLGAAPGTRAVGHDPAAWLGTFLLWLVASSACLPFRDQIVAQWNISHIAGALADAAGAAVHLLAADVLRRAARAAEFPLAGLEHDDSSAVAPAGDRSLGRRGAALTSGARA